MRISGAMLPSRLFNCQEVFLFFFKTDMAVGRMRFEIAETREDANGMDALRFLMIAGDSVVLG
jgi:hypothetical protein